MRISFFVAWWQKTGWGACHVGATWVTVEQKDPLKRVGGVEQFTLRPRGEARLVTVHHTGSRLEWLVVDENIMPTSAVGDDIYAIAVVPTVRVPTPSRPFG